MKINFATVYLVRVPLQERNDSPTHGLDCTVSSASTSSNTDDSFLDDDPALDDIFSQIDVNSAAQRYILAEKFGITRFQDFQQEAIEATLQGNDVLIIQPTGKGKSLCYQFPAVISGSTTLVITPTISLMQDQTHELTAKGINAIFLGSAQTDPLAEIKAFNSDTPASIIYVSPEWLFGKQCHIDRVSALYKAKKIGFIAIDEAHLMYEWKEFREQYQNCASLKSIFPCVPIMALTATALPAIATLLSLKFF